MDRVITQFERQLRRLSVVGVSVLIGLGSMSSAGAAPRPAPLFERTGTQIDSPNVTSLRLVDTRDHDEDASGKEPQSKTESRNKKPEKSMKQTPEALKDPGQPHGRDPHSSPKAKKSVNPNQQGEGDRQDDRRQGGNVERKP